MATNIRFQGLVKTTAEIESDKFAGRIGWNTTLARFVAYYNSTQYAQMARRDVLETFAAGLQDSTLGVGLPMFAGTAGRLSTESVANFRSRIGAVNKAGDTITGNLTVNGWIEADQGFRDANGVQRISSGGAGSLTTLSTTGLATLARATVQDIAVDQVVSALAGGRLAGDPGLTRASTSGVTTKLFVGDGIVQDSSALYIAAPTGQTKRVMFRSGGTARWIIESDATAESGSDAGSSFVLKAVADGGGLIDDPIAIMRAAGASVVLGGSGVTKRPIKATSQAGTGNRLVQAGADGTQSASIPVPTAFAQTLFDDADAAAARATLGITNYSESGTSVYDITGVGQTTINNTALPALPSGYLSEGDCIKIHSAIEVVMAAADYVDIWFGLSTSNDGVFNNAVSWITQNVGDTEFSSFTSGKLFIDGHMTVGAIVGTKRYLCIELRVSDGTTTIMKYYGQMQFTHTQILYPSLGADFFNGGQLRRGLFTMQITKA